MPGIRSPPAQPRGLGLWPERKVTSTDQQGDCPCRSLPTSSIPSTEQGFPKRNLAWVGCHSQAVGGGVSGGETRHLHDKGSLSVGVKAGSWAGCFAESFQAFRSLDLHGN